MVRTSADNPKPIGVAKPSDSKRQRGAAGNRKANAGTADPPDDDPEALMEKKVVATM